MEINENHQTDHFHKGILNELQSSNQLFEIRSTGPARTSRGLRRRCEAKLVTFIKEVERNYRAPISCSQSDSQGSLRSGALALRPGALALMSWALIDEPWALSLRPRALALRSGASAQRLGALAPVSWARSTKY